MTVDHVVGSKSEVSAPRPSVSDVLLDGMFTGMIGALLVALWFFVLDMAAGRPFYTPAMLGGILLNGAAATGMGAVPIEPLEIAVYTAVHFLVFIVVGVAFSYAMTLFERFPIMFFVLLVAFLSLQAGIFVLDRVLGAAMIRQLQPWTVIVANLLAAAGMAFYQWRRHPRVLGKIERLWQDDVDR